MESEKQKPKQPLTPPEPLDVPVKTAPNGRPMPDEPSSIVETKTTAAEITFIVLGTTAFIYFARPVVLPVVVACIAAMTLKPIIRWLSYCRIPPPLSAAVILLLLVTIVSFGFVQLSRPALAWMNEAPEHIAELKQRAHNVLPRIAKVSQTAEAVSNITKTDEQQKMTRTVEVKDTRGTSTIINWTGSLLVMMGESLVVLYLLLASGELFLQKIVHVMPTFQDKKNAVEISNEIQRSISMYLFSVTLINFTLGALVGVGLYLMGVPNPVMWGMLAAILNFIPYFGPITGVILLTMVGLLTFDTFWKGLLPPAWLLLLHLLEANFVTPIVLGRRFNLNPVVIFIWLMFWMWLWGVPGALLSVPLLVSVGAVCNRVPSLSAVGELLTGSRPPDANKA